MGEINMRSKQVYIENIGFEQKKDIVTSKKV